MAYEKVLISSKGNAIRKSEVVPGQPAGIQTGAEIEPGMLIEFDSSYDAQPQQSAAEIVPFRVAVAQEISGMTTDDSYTPDGDFQGLEYASVPSGDSVVAQLYDGSDETDADSVSVGDKLVSNGDGTLRKLDTAGGDSDSASIAVALESADASDGQQAIRVEVL